MASIINTRIKHSSGLGKGFALADLMEEQPFSGELRYELINGEKVKRLYISHGLLKRMSFELFMKILNKISQNPSFPKNEKGEYIVHSIVGIGTGGFLIAKYIYELFKLMWIKRNSPGWKELFDKIDFRIAALPRYDAIILEGYSEDNKKKEIIVRQWLPESARNKSVLLVDDVSDTGNAFREALTLLLKENPSSLISASIHIKDKTSFVPGVFVERVPSDVWIVYPYENESFENEFKDFLESRF